MKASEEQAARYDYQRRLKQLDMGELTWVDIILTDCDTFGDSYDNRDRIWQEEGLRKALGDLNL